MALLIRPRLRAGEGPLGYLLRLAEANGLRLCDLRDLGFGFRETVFGSGACSESGKNASGLTHASAILESLDTHPTAWNRLTPRYCPLCFRETGFWLYAWELYWVDTCPSHKVWLVDHCSSCGHVLTWGRQALRQCQCGAPLVAVSPAACPDSVALLSDLVARAGAGRRGCHPYEPLNGLRLNQVQRLVRLVGCYGDAVPQRKPQKLGNADRLFVSWQVTSLAAEFLCHGPAGIRRLFSQLHNGSLESGNRQLAGRFGHFYHLLFRGFCEPEFAFLRKEFECFIAEQWRGGVGSRNRHLPAELLSRVAWIPATHACRVLGVSKRRMSALVSEGLVSGEEYVGESGRRFFMVNKTDVEAVKGCCQDEIDLETAADLLGLKKTRLARILPWLVPAARKFEGGSSWVIPRGGLDVLMSVGRSLPEVNEEREELVAIGAVLRFWPWTDEDVATFLNSVVAGEVLPLATVAGLRGITSWVFREADLHLWYAQSGRGRREDLSIPEAAEVLEIKQEVAYGLVKRGLLRTERARSGRRYSARVPNTSLAEFRRSYVFGRDLAEQIGTSPRALAERLDRLGVQPVSGPFVDGSRQYLFSQGASLDVAIETICRGVRWTGL